MEQSSTCTYTSQIARSGLLLVASLLLIVAIGFVDFLTGHQVRVYPLYFVPISLGSWGRRSILVVLLAVFATLLWAGSNYWAGLRFSHWLLWWANALAQFVAFSTIGLLIARLSRSLQRERRLARFDQLTQLLNARSFFEAAQAELRRARRYHHPVSLAYLDLDHFKAVNDRQGHRSGDDLLQRVATAIRLSVRSSDLVARMGGDEFVLLLTETGREGAQNVLERLRRLVSAASSAGEEPKVTVSVGAVVCHDPVCDAEELVHAADALMFKAKVDGKDRICLVEIPGPGCAELHQFQKPPADVTPNDERTGHE